MAELSPINFTRGVPASQSFPVAELSEAARRTLEKEAAAVLQYGPASGYGPLCEWIARWQDVDTGQVIAGNGALELVELLCRSMISPGDVVFTEAPSYDRALTLFRRHGAELVGIPLGKRWRS